jgi:hypothetical protein
MAGGASVVVKVGEFLFVFRRALGFGQRRNAADGCKQGDAAFGFVLELLAHGRVSKLPAAGDDMTVVTAVVVEMRKGFSSPDARR